MDQLITTEWLEGELGADDLVVLDCTVLLGRNEDGFFANSGRPSFEEAHIPDARFADLLADLADTDSEQQFALPTPSAFGAAMEQLGVSDNRRVVLYDNDGSMWASRVWFMLRWVGFENAAILDGGLQAWRNEGRPLEAGPAAPSAAITGSLSLAPRHSMIADKAEVMAAIDDGATCLVDALPPQIFSGEVQAYDRAGHIPGAINIPARAMIDADTGRFHPLEDVRARFPDRPEARVVAY